MERIAIENLKPGMILAHTVHLPDGSVLIAKDTAISTATVTKFKELRLPAIYVKNIDAENDYHDFISDETRAMIFRNFFRIDSEIRMNKRINLAIFKESLNKLMDEVIANQKKPLLFSEIRGVHDYIPGHSIHTCVIALRIGLRLNYDAKKLMDLGLGALLHDLGMLRIPYDLVHRIGGLTPEEEKIIQTHCKTGYDLIVQNQDLSNNSALVALQHHERYNGTGYPRKMAGNDINEAARITAIADVFDAMTTERIYRKAKTIPDTLKYMKAQKRIDFDPFLVDILEKVLTA
ncbi:MAG: HD-GYP domain-containing protein [Firmicutes bacterium]|nr:HD-GYP domain-containing protein [Bacillota bacterium]